jgi:MDMPI C-terminal domain
MVPGGLPGGPPESAHPVVFHAVDADAERTLFPGTKPFPIAALTGTAGDLLLAVWRRVPLEVLTVDGDPLQAAAMIDLIGLE